MLAAGPVPQKEIEEMAKARSADAMSRDLH
jgi:hypothetical protein